MRSGLVHFDVAPTTAVPAPVSGVHLGQGQRGPLVLRLFRLTGTRVTLAAPVLPAQLLVLRTAYAGTPVHVATSRPHLWQPLLRSGGTMHVVAAQETPQPGGGPLLTVDDRPFEWRAGAELQPWDCRVEVRSQWTPDELASFARSDLTVFGTVPAEFTALIARAFALPGAATEPLARIDGGSFGLLRRGRIEFVGLDPTAAESAALAQTASSGQPTPVFRR